MASRPLCLRLADLAHEWAQSHDYYRVRTILAHNLALALSPDRPAERLVPAGSGIAWRYAARIYARAQDDWFDEGRCHIAPMVIAAALESGTLDLAAAVAAGYAVQMPVAATYGAVAHRRGLRPTSVFGVTGAAAAAAIGLGLDRAQTAQAIALSLGAAGGTARCMIEETDEWRLDVLRAARAGSEAACLVAGGATAANLALEGENGWCNAMFGDVNGRRLAATLDTRRFSLYEAGLKPYPASGAGFASIDAALQAHSQWRGAMPEHLDLAVDPGSLSVPGSDNRGPFRTMLGAALSLPYLVADAFLTGGVQPFAADRANGEPETIMKRLSLRPDENLAAQTARLTVTGDGKQQIFEGNATTLLDINWDTITRDVPRFASRFAAPPDAVRAILDLLDTPHPSAAAIIERLAF